MRRLLVLSAAILLTACSTTSGPTGPPTPPPMAHAPEADAAVCRPEALADLPGEPLPPAGVSQAKMLQALQGALGEDAALTFWQWFRVEWPGWARDVYSRLAVVHADCVASSAAPPH